MREDPRQIRTREALAAALTRLMADSPLDSITVARLCRDAGVHRTTFYAHADSIQQFAVATFSGELDELNAVAPRSDDPRSVAAQYLDALGSTLTRIAEQRPVYRALFASSSRGAFRGVVEDRLRHRASLALEVFAERGVAGVPRAPREQSESAAFIAGALVGVMDIWACEDDTDAAAAAARVLHLMPRWWPLEG
jgi:AcrR family transcriptional regulator